MMNDVDDINDNDGDDDNDNDYCDDGDDNDILLFWCCENHCRKYINPGPTIWRQQKKMY